MSENVAAVAETNTNGGSAESQDAIANLQQSSAEIREFYKVSGEEAKKNGYAKSEMDQNANLGKAIAEAGKVATDKPQ